MGEVDLKKSPDLYAAIHDCCIELDHDMEGVDFCLECFYNVIGLEINAVVAARDVEWCKMLGFDEAEGLGNTPKFMRHELDSIVENEPDMAAAVVVERKRLEKPLRFYGAEINYETNMGMRPASEIELDGGKLARAALSLEERV